MKKSALDIWYIEDDATDVDIVSAAVAGLDGRMNMTVIDDGEKALRRVGGAEGEPPATVPDLILLDLNLPKIDGREVLREIRARPRYQHLPVIVLSTSSAQHDIDLTYRLGATAYVVKPTAFSGYQETFQALIDFWEKKVDFPSQANAGEPSMWK